ncbi:MAG: hypothetical protein ABF695_12515, partial [Liquorilactobacillus ghanensis]
MNKKFKKIYFILGLGLFSFMLVLFLPNHVEAKWVNMYDTWGYTDSNGRLLENQWLNYNEKWYYFDNNGLMESNTVADDSRGIPYVFGSNGNLLINSWFETYGGAWYYADANGRAKRDQWLNYNGKWYYFDDNGLMESNTVADDSRGIPYVFG